MNLTPNEMFHFRNGIAVGVIIASAVIFIAIWIVT